MKAAWRGMGMAAVGIVVAGCAARGAHSPAGVSQPSPGERVAFSVDGRIFGDDGSERRLKLRFFASSPGSFRFEGGGPIGGVRLIGTVRDGRVRIVVPSRRSYSEGALADDLGSKIVGVPLTGCDLATVIRIATGLARFSPCGGEGAPEVEVPRDQRPGLIVDTTVSGEETLRIGFDWRGEGRFPREARIEALGERPVTLALTDFRESAWPRKTGPDFFWEPIPAGAKQVSASALEDENGP